MQTLVNNNQINRPAATSVDYPLNTYDDKKLCLKAAYRQLFKDNRDMEAYHDVITDSSYLNGQITTRDLVRRLICSDMYVNFILGVNSNFRFVELCFERVLGRSALQAETYQWSSLLASEGLEAFAENLTTCDEYMEAFGEDRIPYRRSLTISPSLQGLPALPKELSAKRYTGEGLINQFSPGSYFKLPPAWTRKVGAVLAVAGGIELTRIIITLALAAYGT